MTVKFTKSIPRYIVAGLFALLWIVFLCSQGSLTFFKDVEGIGTRMSGMFVFLIASTLWEVKMPKLAGRIVSGVFFVFAPFFSVLTIEMLQQGSVTFFSPVYFLNFLVCLGIYVLLLAISNRVRVSVIVGSIFFLIAGIANYFMMDLRNAPLQPWDLAAAQTAVNVMQGLSFKVPDLMVNFLCLNAIMWALVSQLQYEEKMTWKPRLIVSGSLASIAVVMLVTSVWQISPNNSRMTVDAWNIVEASQKNGFVSNFVLNLKTLNNPQPSGYSKTKVNEIVTNAASNYHEENVTSTDQPNIIAIMNESFADLEVLGDTSLSEDVMPFVHSLKKNTIKGNLIVPVFGGGTCNTEYEFLIGNTCYMLRAGSYPMQQFVTKDSPSLATTLKQQGYSTVGMHPLYGTSWNRSRAYPLLGFDKFITIDDFKEPQKLREYITDQQNYDQVIQEYENKGDKPLFLFNVTVQNHGGYSWDDVNLKEDITFPNSEKYRNARQYYALVRESDTAIKNLVNYFKQQKEKTIIVFFGDHQPALEDDYYNELEEGKDKIQKHIETHTVPFFIWANYDIESSENNQMSVNYLQNEVLKTAGLTMTPYNKYLESLRSELPVLSSIVCIDKNGDYYNYQDTDMKYSDLLKEYKMVQYNQVFDKKGRDDSLFYISANAQ